LIGLPMIPVGAVAVILLSDNINSRDSFSHHWPVGNLFLLAGVFAILHALADLGLIRFLRLDQDKLDRLALRTFYSAGRLPLVVLWTARVPKSISPPSYPLPPDSCPPLAVAATERAALPTVNARRDPSCRISASRVRPCRQPCSHRCRK
jgi:hypothetical protein